MSDFLPIQGYLKEHPQKYRALYYCFRDAIAAGRFGVADPIPSSREAAAVLGLSRGTVNLAYEMLAADGYIHATQGKNPTVCWAGTQEIRSIERPDFALSDWGNRLSEMPIPTPPTSGVHFHPGAVDPSLFPQQEWKRFLLRAVREFHPESHEPATGSAALKSAVAQHLNRRRGLNVKGDQVAIVSGSLHAIALLCHILLKKGQTAIMEDPGYRGTLRAITQTGAKCLFGAVDDEGLRPADWNSRLLFVTPSRQFPTGVVLSYNRRAQIVSWARRRNAVIVEDDYDGEFRRSGKPLEPMQQMAPERVVHIGTFSRTISPYLRIGYAVLPEPLIDPFRLACAHFQQYETAWMERTALTEFLRSGAYERHLRRSLRAYRLRHQALLHGLRTHLGEALDIVESDTGLHLFAFWKSDKSLETFIRRCSEADVHLASAGRFFFSSTMPSLIFSFAHLMPDTISAALKKAGKLFAQMD
ncbi:MAG: PLP-dependent aminotransferase family protein [Leptospiraceae bacterium]|nr:PLP-dependent aminotransferase family protein [Leptospiraceae bacterium]MCB1304684.1 PLP-dependent aminotransferase family protein [Leptospiraceae bacterium]